MSQSIKEYYTQEVSKSAAEIRKYSKLVNKYSFLRLFSILFGGFLLYQSLKLELVIVTEVVFLLVVIGFAFLVRQQGRYEKKGEFYEALRTITENELASIESQSNIYSNGEEYEDDGHYYSSDLDIFGKSSLFNLVNRCVTPPGNEKLADWLRKAPAKTVIYERQEAVKELCSEVNWVQQFKALLLFAKDTKPGDIQALFVYFSLPAVFSAPLLKVYIRVVPYLLILLGVLAWYVHLLLIPIIILVLLNGFLVLKNQPEVNKADRMLGKAGKTLTAYSEAFKEIENRHWKSPLCRSLAKEIDNPASFKLSAELKQLGVLAERLEYR